jgi:ankyrin repeat protein
MKTQMNNSIKAVVVAAFLFVEFLALQAHAFNKVNPSVTNKVPAVSQSGTKPPRMDIFTAALFGDLKVINQHIEAGTDLNAKDDYGSTPLIIASTFGKTEVAKTLIEAGVDLNITNRDGGTALHSAAFLCRTEIVKALIENGADKSIKNIYGSTARESVMSNWDVVKPIYDQFSKDLGPLGLKLDYDHLKETRPVIAEMLK